MLTLVVYFGADCFVCVILLITLSPVHVVYWQIETTASTKDTHTQSHVKSLVSSCIQNVTFISNKFILIQLFLSKKRINITFFIFCIAHQLISFGFVCLSVLILHSLNPPLVSIKYGAFFSKRIIYITLVEIPLFSPTDLYVCGLSFSVASFVYACVCAFAQFNQYRLHQHQMVLSSSIHLQFLCNLWIK